MDDFSGVVCIFLQKQWCNVQMFCQFQHKLNWVCKFKMYEVIKGTEFTNGTIQNLCLEKGIIHETFCVDTPQQNGFTECKNCHLLKYGQSIEIPKLLFPLLVRMNMFFPQRMLLTIPPHKFLVQKPPIKVHFVWNLVMNTFKSGWSPKDWSDYLNHQRCTVLFG